MATNLPLQEDWTSPVGNVNLRFGANTGGGVDATPANMQFLEDAWVPPIGTVNLRFGPIGGGGGTLLRVGTVSGFLPVPQSDINATTPITVNIAATTPPPQAAANGDYDINVYRGPNLWLTSKFEKPADPQRLPIRAVWSRSKPLSPDKGIRHEEAAPLGRAVTQNPGTAARLRAEPGSRWERAAQRGRERRSAWEYAPRIYNLYRDRWEESDPRGTTVGSPYENPETLQRFYRGAWQVSDELAGSFESPFQQGRRVSPDRGTRYEQAGFAGKISGAPVEPPVEPPIPPLPPVDLDFHFCVDPQRVTWRQLQFGVNLCFLPVLVPTRRIYTVSNTAQIVRVSDGKDIPASSVSLSINVDNYAWDMQANINSRDALALVEGTDANPVDVDVIINGNTWRVLVDAWTLQETARGRSGTIRGRSRAAYLAAPYAATRDYKEGQLRLAQQLADQELPPGWDLQWDINDWLVPAGAWEYQNLSPIDAMNRIAIAGGGYLQSHKSVDRIIVKPRYPAAPWEWSGTQPDIDIPEDIMIQRGNTKNPGQGVNAVWVHGSDPGGVMARVLRTGTAGDVLAQTIVDPLITDVIPARERGIAAIAGSARRATEQHELPISPNFGGLIEPGALVGIGKEVSQVFQRDYTGLVRGVSVTADAQRAGSRGTALRVRQIIDIERHYEA